MSGLYDDSDTAVVLLDTNFYCVDANRSGRSLFAGPMQLYERNSRRHRGYMQEAEELAKSIQEEKKREIEKNDSIISVSVRRCTIQEASWIYSRCLGYYQPEKRDAADAGIKGKSRDADGAEK